MPCETSYKALVKATITYFLTECVFRLRMKQHFVSINLTIFAFWYLFLAAI